MPSPGITVEDVDAFSDVSNGSTISVGSAASGGSGRMPRPPSGGSKRPKSAQGRRSRLAKSPYTAQQVKGSTKPLPPKPAARNMWITAMRNGNATLSTENSPMKSWAGSRSSHGKQNKTGTRTRHFSDVVQIGDSKNKSSHIRSASMSASEPLVSGGGVAYKPKEDYYDEIIELKKIINALKAENNIVNTKLRRVEGENVLKDRKMEDLLNPRKQPEDVRRTLTDKKGDTSAIVNSLKQKLHAVERTVKDKETELSQLKKEMKMTNIEELQIQSETYYQEVQRLQLALIERQQSLVREPFGSTSTPRNHSISKGKSSGFTLQQLTDENNHLRAENQGLKRDLLTAIENVSSGSKKVPLKVDYADMNRGQLLGRIRELEEQVQESDGKKAVSRKESLTEDRQHGDEFRRKGSVSKASEVPGRIELKGTTSQKLAQLQEREAELLEEREKQRSVIERLKEDRAHYRSVADDLRVKLRTTEEELERSSGDKSAGNERRKSTSSLTSVRRSSIKESSTTENNDEDMDRMLNDFQQQRAAKTLQRQWRGYKGRQGKETERQVQDEQNQAAMTLQKNWRKHKQTAKRLEGESHEEAVTEIQAALRGHVIRRKRLETLDGDLEMADADDAIVSIQSALRAHSARTRHQEDSDDETVPRDRRTKGSSSHARFNSEPGLYDDELGSSSDRSTGKRHPEPATSGQRRSSLTGSRRAVITAPRFSNISENSDEEDVIATSYSRAQTKTRTGGLRGLSNKHENDQRKKKNTFEIVDSDDDDDDDDDDDEDAVISRPRRSLDTGRALDTGRGFDTGRGLDTGISPQRPSLSRSNRALDPSGSSSSEATTRSPVSRPGLSRSSGRLNPSKDQEVLESSRDEGPQRPGLRSKRPLSAQRPSLTRKDKNSNGLKSTETSSTGWSRTSAGSDEDSDDDGVIVTGKKTKTAGGDGKAARPSLTRKSPAKTTPSKGGSIVNSLDNFFSSTGSSKGSTDNKSSRRRRSLLADSDDDDDDDDDDIVVSSRTKTKSKVGGKTSQLGRKDSAADLWATSDKGGGSSSKRKSSSDNSLKTSLKSTSRKTWGQEFEFEGPSRRPDSQLDELF